MCLLEQGYKYFVCIAVYYGKTSWTIDKIKPNNKAVVIIPSHLATLEWSYKHAPFPKFKTKKEALKFLFLSGIDITE